MGGRDGEMQGAAAVRWSSQGASLAEMFFEQALGVAPGPADHDEVTALWQALPEDQYSANRLIHRLVDTNAFGCP